MGRVDIILSDDLERELRLEAGRRFGARRGSLKKAIEEAIRLWLEIGKVSGGERLEDAIKRYYVSKIEG